MTLRSLTAHWSNIAHVATVLRNVLRDAILAGLCLAAPILVWMLGWRLAAAAPDYSAEIMGAIVALDLAATVRIFVPRFKRYITRLWAWSFQEPKDQGEGFWGNYPSQNDR
jgi:hypothetical protein